MLRSLKLSLPFAYLFVVLVFALLVADKVRNAETVKQKEADFLFYGGIVGVVMMGLWGFWYSTVKFPGKDALDDVLEYGEEVIEMI